MLRLLTCVALGICFYANAAFAEQSGQATPAAASKPSAASRAARAVMSLRAGQPKAATSAAKSAETPVDKKPGEAATPTPGKIGSGWCKRAVVRLNHSPAVDIARVLNESFQAEGVVTVVADPVTNSLVVSALPAAMDDVTRLVKELDRRPAMVAIEILIAEVKRTGKDETAAAKHAGVQVLLSKEDIATQLRDLEKRGRVEVLERPRLMTIDNQPAFIQVGQRVPRVQGTMTSPMGRSNSVTLENVGMIVGLTPRVADDNTVTMQIDVEKSHLGAQEEGTPIATSTSGEVTRTPSVVTITAQSTVSLPDGQTAVLAGLVSRSDAKQTELVVLVSPKIVRTP